jgi:cell division inhibitor SepF
MGAMYRLKAYFGMVPAEEMEEYADESVIDRYGDSRRPERSVRDYVDERWDDRYSYADEAPERAVERDRYDDEWDRRPPRPAVVERPQRSASVPGPSGPSGAGPSPIRGALAIDPDAALREPIRAVPSISPAVPEQRERPAGSAAALTRITTLQPCSYREARTIGERYRDGVPVIINLTELDVADAKRIVDFAAGLAFALRGSMDKVTNRVFLLTPADVEVSADDARKLAERGVFRPD